MEKEKDGQRDLRGNFAIHECQKSFPREYKNTYLILLSMDFPEYNPLPRWNHIQLYASSITSQVF